MNLSSLLSGNNSTSTRLKLGDVEFTSFEVPDQISLGAKQQMAVHKLIGGTRVVDVLGVDYDQISWSGIITGDTAGTRVGTLEKMRDAGNTVQLTLDNYIFDVVISSFVPTYVFTYKRPYSIELTVVERKDKPAGPKSVKEALDALVNGDMGKMLGLASSSGDSTLTGILSTVSDAIAPIQTFVEQTAATIQPIVQTITTAQQQVRDVITALEASASSVTTLGGLVPGNPVSTTVNNLLKQADAATRLPVLYQTQDLLGRLSKNVQSGQASNGSQTLIQAGGTLYQVSAKQYNDASQWTKIAAINNLSDPYMTGVNTIVVPNAQG